MHRQVDLCLTVSARIIRDIIVHEPISMFRLLPVFYSTVREKTIMASAIIVAFVHVME